MTDPTDNKAKMKQAMQCRLNGLLQMLGRQRSEFADQTDAGILRTLSKELQEEGRVQASLIAMQLANTAQSLGV